MNQVPAGTAAIPGAPLPSAVPFPSNWRLPSIDGLRATAMMMVFVCHMYAFTNNPRIVVHGMGRSADLLAIVPHFPTGVDLFMVLSGFCLFLPLCKSEQALARWDWRDFYQRRVRRIVPPYYAAIVYAALLPFALVLLMRTLHLAAKWPQLDSGWVYLAHFLFIQTFFTSTFGHVNAALWSMALEAQFYLVFPLVVLGYRVLRWRFIVGMVAVSIIYRILSAALTTHATDHVQFMTSIFFLGRWMQFACGMASAWWVARQRRAQQWYGALAGTALFCAGLILYVAACNLCGDLSWQHSLSIGVACGAVIIALCCSKTPVCWFFENNAMSWLGYISYSVFLLHWPTGYYFDQLLRRVTHLSDLATFLVLCTVGLAVVVGTSYLFFLAIEKPCLTAIARKRTSEPMVTPTLPVSEAAAP